LGWRYRNHSGNTICSLSSSLRRVKV
jgi:hypothetical protein